MKSQTVNQIHASFLQIIEIIKPIEIQKGCYSIDIENVHNINKFDWSEIGLKVSFMIRTYEGCDIHGKKEINDSQTIEISGENFGYTFVPEMTVIMYNKLKKVLPKYENTYKLVFTDRQEIKSEPILVVSETVMTKYKTAVKMSEKRNELRPQFESVYFNDGEICSTDSHKLYYDSFDCDAEIMLTKEMQNFVKNAKSFNVYDSGDKLTIETPEKTQSFNKETIAFPQYKAVIPVNNPNYFEVDKKKFIKALKQTKHTANQASKLIILEVNNNRLSSKGQDIDFSCASKTEINVINSNCNICFGIKYEFIEQIINSTKGDILHFSLSDPSRAILINKNFLIMPMMIENAYSENLGEYVEFVPEVKNVKKRVKKAIETIAEPITEPKQELTEEIINVILDYCENTGYNVNDFMIAIESKGVITLDSVNEYISSIKTDLLDLQLMFDISEDMQDEIYYNDAVENHNKEAEINIIQHDNGQIEVIKHNLTLIHSTVLDIKINSKMIELSDGTYRLDPPNELFKEMYIKLHHWKRDNTVNKPPIKPSLLNRLHRLIKT